MLLWGDPSRKYLVVRSYKICKGYQNTVEKLTRMWNLQTLSIERSAEKRFETQRVCHANKHRTPLNTLSGFAFNSFVLSPYTQESRLLSVWTKSLRRAEKN